MSKEFCGFCFNARICPPSDDPFETVLTDENDFSSHSVGKCDKEHSIMISSGYGKPLRMNFRKWFKEISEWHSVGNYYPKYCPECGRRLDEYEKKSENCCLDIQEKPMCKVGDTIYQTDGLRIYPSVITNIIFETNHSIAFDKSAIGKSIFLTKEEVQRRLDEYEKKSEENNNDKSTESL